MCDDNIKLHLFPQQQHPQHSSEVNHVQLDCCMPKSCSCKLLVAEFHAAGSFKYVLEISPNLANAGHGGSFANSSMQHPFAMSICCERLHYFMGNVIDMQIGTGQCTLNYPPLWS